MVGLDPRHPYGSGTNVSLSFRLVIGRTDLCLSPSLFVIINFVLAFVSSEEFFIIADVKY